jgi:protein-S-isoprenylcysteine O-methyltransferase Ste14
LPLPDHDTTQTEERGAEVYFPPPLVFVGLTLLGVAVQYFVGPITSMDQAWISLIGLVILFAGFALMVAAVLEFRRTGQDPKPWKPSPELVLRGPYLFTRNPMYVGLTGVQFGLGMLLSNLWVSLLAPLALLIVHFIAVLPEEKYLIGRFGNSYGEYRKRIRRYL